MTTNLNFYLVTEGNGGVDYSKVQKELSQKDLVGSVKLVNENFVAGDLAIFWRKLASNIRQEKDDTFVCLDYVPNLLPSRSLRQGYTTMARHLKSLDELIPAITHIDISSCDNEALNDKKLQTITKFSYVLAPSKNFARFIQPPEYTLHPEAIHYIQGTPNSAHNVADALYEMSLLIQGSREIPEDLGKVVRELETSSKSLKYLISSV